MADYDGKSGIISKIHLENFMCHSNLDIEFGDYVNFITGQNGSGKSAILTALCVAFGTRARGTQRANTLKDFIRNGCSYALVRVELKNKGLDAFKPDVYGDVVVVERRISESTSSITLKNRQGRRMGTKRDDLREVIEHFNIDVENPCVIMSQDKSREFLHSGNAKDKFRFFYRATLLQRLDDLLNSIEKQLNDATAQLHILDQSLSPELKELEELQKEIDAIQSLEDDSVALQLVREKLAWVLVYDTERQIGDKSKEIEKLKARKISRQRQIDMEHDKVVELEVRLEQKQIEINKIFERTIGVDQEKEELADSCHTAQMVELELKNEKKCITDGIEVIDRKIELRKKQIDDFHKKHIKDTQDEKNEIEEKLRGLEAEVGNIKDNCESLEANKDEITKAMHPIYEDIKDITKKMDEIKSEADLKSSHVQKLRKYQENKGTRFGAFGERWVTILWKAIEDNRSRFTCPPIGPIGAHVKLINGDKWSIAVESAVGKLLDAFIVTNYEDSRTLRECARRLGNQYLRIIIYEFSRPRLEISPDMLPDHPTVLSALHTDNQIVRNVLIDVGSAEMQVLVEDYKVGRTIAFDLNIQNVKEVFTSIGQKLFQRRSAQFILPPYHKLRNRLCVSYSDQIIKGESEIDALTVKYREKQELKKTKEIELNNLKKSRDSIQNSKKTEEHKLLRLELEMKDLRVSLSAVAETAPALNVDDRNEEISNFYEEIQRKQIMLEDIEIRLGEAGVKAADCNAALQKFVDSTEAIRVELSKAEEELVTLGTELHETKAMEVYYEKKMRDDVLTKLENAETEYVQLGDKIKEKRSTASIICPESDIEDLNCEETNSEHLSAEYTRLSNKISNESRSFPESIEVVKLKFEKKHRKISRKQQTYETLRGKLELCEKALELRWVKFENNVKERIRDLKREFNGHLAKKGIKGGMTANFEEKTLSIKVTMPQDASHTAVCDTRGLSGGERSFSTLCFALTIHEMTEAPFRAMDEFDVFMDAVSRKISLDAVVDFALGQGSQWIFITPNDISMVRDHERIKKQQMAAPRG